MRGGQRNAESCEGFSPSNNIAFARGGGRLLLRRTYRFEFSDTGNNRLKGSVTLSGERLVLISLEPHSAYESGTTLLH